MIRFIAAGILYMIFSYLMASGTHPVYAFAAFLFGSLLAVWRLVDKETEGLIN